MTPTYPDRVAPTTSQVSQISSVAIRSGPPRVRRNPRLVSSEPFKNAATRDELDAYYDRVRAGLRPPPHTREDEGER